MTPITKKPLPVRPNLSYHCIHTRKLDVDYPIPTLFPLHCLSRLGVNGWRSESVIGFRLSQAPS